MQSLRELVGEEGCVFLDTQDPILLLRTTDKYGRSAFNGFQWPTSPNQGVIAPDWDPSDCCGGGLHGCLWGEGHGHLLDWSEDALWYIVAANPTEIMTITEDGGGKVKVPRCWTVAVGKREQAIEMLLNFAPGKSVIGATIAAGDNSTLTAGDYSTIAAGDDSTIAAGDDSTITAGD